MLDGECDVPVVSFKVPRPLHNSAPNSFSQDKTFSAVILTVSYIPVKITTATLYRVRFLIFNV